jgi:hypothetical protein
VESPARRLWALAVCCHSEEPKAVLSSAKEESR